MKKFEYKIFLISKNAFEDVTKKTNDKIFEIEMKILEVENNLNLSGKTGWQIKAIQNIDNNLVIFMENETSPLKASNKSTMQKKKHPKQMNKKPVKKTSKKK